MAPVKHHTKTGFCNTETLYKPNFKSHLLTLKRYLTTPRIHARPQGSLPQISLSADTLKQQRQGALYRLGHSTVLIHLDGKWLLTDPVFSDRASPVTWAGPKRFQPAPIQIEELPFIDAIIISHDHYDHLDKASVIALAPKAGQFICPLRVGNHLRRWGISSEQIIELDWWQHHNMKGIELTACPSQHYSGRTLRDKDQTLWASWSIKGVEASLYFSGDSGYFGGFKEVGSRLGPFDFTLMETGAYDEAWADVHMQPEQSLQAHRDLRGKVMVPIHNATFDLALHPWFDPLQRIDALAKSHHIPLMTPMLGEPLLFTQTPSQVNWWCPQSPKPVHSVQALKTGT